MKISAAMVWWNERPEDLEACVRGVAKIADRLVAVDGAYTRYPGATIRSPLEQIETIRRVAAEVGLEAEIVEPTQLWVGEVAKRSFTYARAAKGSDWIAVLDADWIIHADRAAARAEIEAFGPEVDVVGVDLWTPPGDHIATGWHQVVGGMRQSNYPGLFRALPGIRAERLHWLISALKNGERVWLHHGDEPTSRSTRPAIPLTAHYEIEHRTLHRTEEQVLASRAFCNDRVIVMEMTNQEDDGPGLPAPVFDYVTIPYVIPDPDRAAARAESRRLARKGERDRAAARAEERRRARKGRST